MRAGGAGAGNRESRAAQAEADRQMARGGVRDQPQYGQRVRPAAMAQEADIGVLKGGLPANAGADDRRGARAKGVVELKA